MSKVQEHALPTWHTFDDLFHPARLALYTPVCGMHTPPPTLLVHTRSMAGDVGMHSITFDTHDLDDARIRADFLRHVGDLMGRRGERIFAFQFLAEALENVSTRIELVGRDRHPLAHYEHAQECLAMVGLSMEGQTGFASCAFRRIVAGDWTTPVLDADPWKVDLSTTESVVVSANVLKGAVQAYRMALARQKRGDYHWLTSE